MKRALLALSLLASAAAQAQRIDPAATLRTYVSKVLPQCPGGILSLNPMQGRPANFTAYVAQVRSSDQYCGTQRYVLASPRSGQVLIGTVIPLPADGRPAAARITDQATQLLGHQVKAIVAPFPLPDGLKAVTISRDTPFGSFAYLGFVDQSESFLVVGFRGNLNTSPAQTLRESLNTTAGARRGSMVSKTEILELSDFQCPTCARAHEMVEPFIRQNLNRISYVRIDLPLFEHHEWALPAAMAARAIQRVAPSKYWEYVDYVFKNQEEVGKRKFDEFIRDYCEDHDIDWSAVQKIYASKPERQALLDQVSRAFALGVNSTPTFIVNGQIMGFGPEGAFTMAAIKDAVGQSPAPATPKKKQGK